MEKIKSFDFQKKLFKVHSKEVPDLPIDKLFPENLTMLLLTVMIASVAGYFLDLAQLVWFLSLPTSIACGLFVCFIVQYFLENLIDYLKENNLPKGEAASDLDGYCTFPIEPGEWGKVKLLVKEREYEVNAATAGEAYIDVGEKVITLHEEGGFYIVVRVDEIYEGLED
jgi:hypothetical protein